MDGPAASSSAARLPAALADLALPVIAAPMFIVSGPDLVVAQCVGGVVGSFPALNARPKEELDRWLTRIEAGLAAARADDRGGPVAPFAVNQIVHATNDRLDHDLDICARHRVPMIITSLRAPNDVVAAAHAWGGLVFHDVTNVRHAEKALEAGVDGLILVCAGAGGHAGTLSPFALVGEVRRFWNGPLVLSGAITTGSGILAAQAMGADLAYLGTRFIASAEAAATDRYKEMILKAAAADIVYTPFFSGVAGNYLKPSIAAAGLDPDVLVPSEESRMSFASGHVRPWRDIWSAGQGVGTITDAPPVAEIITRLKAEYAAARAGLCGSRRGCA